MIGLEESKKEFIQEVQNRADLFPQSSKEPTNYQINDICEKLWKRCDSPDTRDWYKDGNIKGQHLSTTNSNEQLKQLIEIFRLVILKHMRDNNKPVGEKITKLFSALEIIADTIIQDSVDTITKDEGQLDHEEVVAFIQGFVHSRYSNIAKKYED